MSQNIDRNPADVEPPRKARRDFLQYKQETQKESTARAYKYPTRSFIEYAESHGVQTTGDISQRHVAGWIDQRRTNVKPITVRNNAKHLRVFLKWMAQRELIEWGIHEKMEIPSVPDRADVNTDVIRKKQAEQTLSYLETYEYGTVYHALFHTMWHTGCRISGAIALDLDDLDRNRQDSILQFRNRKASGTDLKNGMKSERDVTISDSLAQVLQDYISGQRHRKTDDYGREPLFTTTGGRLSRQRAYKNIVAFTRPCVATMECPHNRDMESCEAAQKKQQAPSCPSSVSLHPVRKGSITNHINEGWPKEPLSERVDVSVEVLEKHYDFRKNERKRQNRRQFLHD
jgi:site-specific recombinase XerD